MSSYSRNAPTARKSKGRQKVSMTKMENQSNLQVTFSKRRAGLFKKASELCTLCGAEGAIVVFSPADKVYCFGHPNVQTVLDKFVINDNVAPNIPAANISNNNMININHPTSQLIIEAHRNSTIRELNMELTQIEGLLRAEKQRADELDAIKKTGQTQQWFPARFEEYDYAQLRLLKENIMGFKKNLDAKVQKDMFRVGAAANYNPLENPNNYNAGGFPSSSLGFGSSDVSNCVNVNPVFNNAPFSVGSISNNGLVSNHQANPMITSDYNGGLVSCDYSNNPMLFGGGSGTGYSAPSSSMPIPIYDPMTSAIGSTSFGVSGGYNNVGYDPRMF